MSLPFFLIITPGRDGSFSVVLIEFGPAELVRKVRIDGAAGDADGISVLILIDVIGSCAHLHGAAGGSNIGVHAADGQK